MRGEHTFDVRRVRALRSQFATLKPDVRCSAPFRAKSDALPPFCRLRHELADGVEHDAELSIVLLFEGGELFGQLSVRPKDLTQSHECAHDLDVDLYRLAAAQDGREHRNALLGESVGRVAPSSPR